MYERMLDKNKVPTENEIKEYWDHKYPCEKGGWIHYRIEEKEDLKDIGVFLSLRTKKTINF
jgi:hypothetical protein